MSIIRRNVKDSLFIKIFSAPEHKQYLLSLFNALNKKNYPAGTELEITTIENVIYMGIKNDVSCIVDNHMNLIEHQSTINPNMPLRGLLYFARLYEKYLAKGNHNIYLNNLIKVPTPSYFVLYNGEKSQPDYAELKLSDAFIHPQNNHRYEWTVDFLNINIGHNQDLLASCKMLNEYSRFFEEIRANKAKNIEIETAVNMAVDACIQRDGILSDYLRQHKAEVIGMILTEYNEQETLEAMRRNYDEQIATLKAENADQANKIADKDAKLAEQDALIAELKAQLAAATQPKA